MDSNIKRHIAVILMISLFFSPISCKSSKKGPITLDEEKDKDSAGLVQVGTAPLPEAAKLAQHQYATPPFNTENYDKINENIFLDVKTNPLSTFSVDVDRASYGNVRRFLQQGQLPPADAVRVEEMINYFDYEFAGPTDDAPFAIYTEMSQAPWNKEHLLTMITLKGKEVDVAQVPASNLVFLLDVSGSMQDENKLPLVKQSLRFLIHKLRPQDRVAVVTYAGAAGLVLPSTSGKDKDKIIRALDQLEAGGSTAGGEGIQLAYKVAKENFIKNGNNRVVLATDGDFNVGISSEGELERLIEKERATGVFLTILGFGMGNYQDAKIKTLSNAGNGNYAYIDSILEAQKTLGKEMWGTLFTIAKDVKLQVEFNPALVKAYRLVGYEDRLLKAEDFNEDKKDAGDIGSGHIVTAFYEIIPTTSKENVSNVDPLKYQTSQTVPSADVMTIKLRYKKPKEDTSKLITKVLTNSDLKTEGLSDNFLFASAVAEFGQLLRDSKFKGDASYKAVLARAKAAMGKDAEGYRAEFVELVAKAKELTK